MIQVYVAIKSKKLNDDFCSSIDKSNFAKVTDVFYTLKECRQKLSVRLPHVLLLGLDLSDGYWADFCEELRETYPGLKILAVASFDEYAVFKNTLNSLTSGYISRDALPKVIVSAVDTVMKGAFFRYDKIEVSIEKDQSEPEWQQTTIQQMIQKVKTDDNPHAIIEKMSQMIHSIDNERTMMVKSLLTTDKGAIDHEYMDRYLMQLIENMLIQGCTNWEIADTLNINIETVRVYRMELIMKLSGKNSMLLAVKKDGKSIKLARREIQLLRLIAAGYTSREIADNILYVDKETVKTVRKNLIQKFEVKNAMSLVISAMRMGLLKIEDIDDLL
ncbi:MAG: LuxR C-terminal-related transcriptional regulator [Tannerella sp.]|nr:LuxR C-terminal-related transcriptional regulator [Tannerella sp.]